MKILIITSGGGDYSASHVKNAFSGQRVGDVIGSGAFDDGGESFNEEHDDDGAGIEAEVREVELAGDVEVLLDIVRSTFGSDHYGIWAEFEEF